MKYVDYRDKRYKDVLDNMKARGFRGSTHAFKQQAERRGKELEQDGHEVIIARLTPRSPRSSSIDSFLNWGCFYR